MNSEWNFTLLDGSIQSLDLSDQHLYGCYADSKYMDCQRQYIVEVEIVKEP